MDQAQRVTVTDFDMSFGRMVWFMVKWVLASIPALAILAVVGVVFGGLIIGLGAAAGAAAP